MTVFKRLAVTLTALAALLGVTTPAQASASYWKNAASSVTYVTVQAYNNGWYYYNVQPGYAAGSWAVKIWYYKLTYGFCATEYPDSGHLNGIVRHRVGSNTNPWVYVPDNEVVYVFHC